MHAEPPTQNALDHADAQQHSRMQASTGSSRLLANIQGSWNTDLGLMTIIGGEVRDSSGESAQLTVTADGQLELNFGGERWNTSQVDNNRIVWRGDAGIWSRAAPALKSIGPTGGIGSRGTGRSEEAEQHRETSKAAPPSMASTQPSPSMPRPLSTVERLAAMPRQGIGSPSPPHPLQSQPDLVIQEPKMLGHTTPSLPEPRPPPQQHPQPQVQPLQHHQHPLPSHPHVPATNVPPMGVPFPPHGAPLPLHGMPRPATSPQLMLLEAKVDYLTNAVVDLQGELSRMMEIRRASAQRRAVSGSLSSSPQLRVQGYAQGTMGAVPPYQSQSMQQLPGGEGFVTGFRRPALTMMEPTLHEAMATLPPLHSGGQPPPGYMLHGGHMPQGHPEWPHTMHAGGMPPMYPSGGESLPSHPMMPPLVGM
eukprot:gnl/TRDRNA2_/TRDRNA2_52487_c0_seq2.p1 gnl/TRDRNA2_/TRDRNA2_52487_c0~~gnl/TRDRNA2_/TRDRNA2_52487_c0_seq2.p1  ORF type:complete len:453 (+),score=63.50 gnl/TRDRNA2_/TRDRNA2_52487_c0_seq2:99-1361(+)